jgi:hypothetical protein
VPSVYVHLINSHDCRLGTVSVRAFVKYSYRRIISGMSLFELVDEIQTF